MAKLNKIANAYRLDKMKDDIALSVANSYLQILFNKEQLKVQKNQNVITKENLKRTQDLIEAGTVPAGDIYELQATDASQQQQIINSENALLISKIGLCQTLLIEDYVNFDISDEVIDLPISNVVNETQEAILEKAKLEWASQGWDAKEIELLEEAWALTTVKDKETYREDKKEAKSLRKEANTLRASRTK